MKKEGAEEQVLLSICSTFQQSAWRKKKCKIMQIFAKLDKPHPSVSSSFPSNVANAYHGLGYVPARNVGSPF
jgi:hypothetical protein